MNKKSYFEAQQKCPMKQTSVQSRLDSNRDYQSLPEKYTDDSWDSISNSNGAWGSGAGCLGNSASWIRNIQKDKKPKPSIIPNKFPLPELYEEAPHVFIPKLQQIKQELIAQFNLTGIFDKIRAIKNTLLNNTN